MRYVIIITGINNMIHVMGIIIIILIIKIMMIIIIII